ncbi:MAG: carbon storage regulator CsrA [Ignavibacteriales bacterium]|nr:carbon storage regulator CsrA [Ignavibacteriales bacterium]
MLVLTRKINEEIFIGSDITIKIVSSSEGLVKIGINAPRSVQVYRKEVYDRVKQQTIEASKASIQTIADLQNFKIKKV